MKNLPTTRNNSFRNVLDLQRQMDRFFNDFWNGGSWGGAQLPTLLNNGTENFSPSCDIEETDSHYLMSFDLPGVKRDDIKIELKDNMLMVSGERKEEHEEKAKTRHSSERFYGSFYRTFQLPSSVKPEDVQADYADGVLRVAVPKTEAKKGTQVKIGEGKSGFWDKLLGRKKEETRTSGSQEKRISSEEKVA